MASRLFIVVMVTHKNITTMNEVVSSNHSIAESVGLEEWKRENKRQLNQMNVIFVCKASAFCATHIAQPYVVGYGN